jgi:hypothetical protein
VSSEAIITAKLYGGTVTVHLNTRSHRYQIEGVQGYPDGVTTICNGSISKFLDDWAGRVCVDHVRKSFLQSIEAEGTPPELMTFLATCEDAETAHQRVRDSAGDSGSEVHNLIEMHLRGEPLLDPPSNEKVEAGFGAYLKWRETADVEFLDVERLVYSKELFYCGKTDFVGRRNARLMIGDFKTGSGVYDEQPYQLAAYAVAIEEETGDKIEDGLIVHLDKNTGRFKEYPIALDDDMKRAWKACVVHYKNLKRVRKTVKELKNGKRAA